jgi:hypothetical protein
MYIYVSSIIYTTGLIIFSPVDTYTLHYTPACTVFVCVLYSSGREEIPG